MFAFTDWTSGYVRALGGQTLCVKHVYSDLYTRRRTGSPEHILAAAARQTQKVVVVKHKKKPSLRWAAAAPTITCCKTLGPGHVVAADDVASEHASTLVLQKKPTLRWAAAAPIVLGGCGKKTLVQIRCRDNNTGYASSSFFLAQANSLSLRAPARCKSARSCKAATQCAALGGERAAVLGSGARRPAGAHQVSAPSGASRSGREARPASPARTAGSVTATFRPAPTPCCKQPHHPKNNISSKRTLSRKDSPGHPTQAWHLHLGRTLSVE